MSRIIVQKFGGSSVATADKIRHVAQLIYQRSLKGDRLCVVVSAMGKTTDQLLAQAHQVSRNPSRRELDMLLSCGERASMALLAMALEDLGCSAVSLTGSQSGIITSDVHSGAKILEVRPERVMSELLKGRVVIVAGFQGISIRKEITTLGRGGSDTTAVALSAALNAEACEIYSDVPGILSADPKWVEGALPLEQIGVQEMEELSLFGAKVMHAQALQFAKEHGVEIHALKTGDEHSKTLILPKLADEKLSRVLVTCKDPVYRLKGAGEKNLETLLEKFSEKQISHVQVHGSTLDGGSWDCFVHPEDAHGFDELSQSLAGAQRLPDCATVTMVSVGLCEMPIITSRAIKQLRRHKIEIKALSTAPNRSTFVLNQGEGVRAMQLLHDMGQLYT